jgi:hypothetical protein
MDGWTGHMMKKTSRKTITMSFTICNEVSCIVVVYEVLLALLQGVDNFVILILFLW